MSLVETAPNVAAAETETSPEESRTRLWTREEFYKMAEMGFFQGQKAELIEGEIIVVSSPQSFEHSASIHRIFKRLSAIFEPERWVRAQFPMVLEPRSEPEPDVSVAPKPFEAYEDHPTEALLAVEVSQTTLKYDKTLKASLYASRAIPEYWIVNLVKRQLEVRREPMEDADEPSGWRYALLRVLGENDSVEPLAAPGQKIAVRDLLPLAKQQANPSQEAAV
jgi:Uma2 family endonuclease